MAETNTKAPRAVNQEQISANLRLLAGALVGYGVGKGIVPQEAAPEIVAAVVYLGLAVWTWWSHKDDNLIKSAESVPTVQAIVAPGTEPAGSDNHPRVVDTVTEAAQLTKR